MRPVERRRFRLQLALGAILTLLTIAADRLEVLLPFEQVLYDLRCRHCQWFLKAPQPPVHLDIDGNAIEEMGRIPWPRTTVAALVRELYDAGAKVVALDILFSDPSAAAEDQALADAFASGKGTVVAVQLRTDRDPDAYRRLIAPIEQILQQDLTLAPDEVRRRIEAADPSFAKWTGNFNRLFFEARKSAMLRRITGRLDAGDTDPTVAFTSVLPTIDRDIVADTSPQVKLFFQQWDQALRLRAIQRFLTPADNLQGPSPYQAENRDPPILPLVRSAAIAGFTNHDPDPGGKVRAVPLWMAVDGKLLPQFGLAAVCLAVGAKPDEVRLTEHHVIIPRKGEPDLVVPVHRRNFSTDKGVEYCINVPTFGRSGEGNWASMYDFPQHRKDSGHFSVLAAWRIELARARIAGNEAVADVALLDALRIVEPEDADNYASLAPGLRPRQDFIEQALPKIDQQLKDYAELPDLPSELKQARDNLVGARAVLAEFARLDPTLRQELAGHRQALRDIVQNRAVFIGYVADGLDQVPTPLHARCPGVVVHGAIYNAIMSGELWTTANPLHTDAITLILGFAATLLVARLSPARGLAACAAFVLVYSLVNGVALFDYGNLIVGAAGPLTAVAVVWAALTLTRVISEIRERHRITRRFQSYVDPSLVRYVIEHPELVRLEGEVREMSIAFTDLAGFTTLAEQLGAPAVKILSQYKGKMVPVIRGNRGLINSFMGDGIMFSFGAPEANPNHAVDAVNTVFAMHAALEEFNRALAQGGHAPLGMRAGVSTGNVVVGDSGSEEGCDYTAIGDTTNLGARLESANKAIGTKTLITGRTVELLEGKYLVRPIARLRVAGKSKSVMVYEPLAPTGAATEPQRKLAAMTTEMFDHYVAGRFPDCIAAAERMDAEFGKGKLTAMYAETSRQHIADSPAEFGGEIQLKEK